MLVVMLVIILIFIVSSEDLETVPHQLSVYIAENHFLHASELLVKSVETIFGEDLLKVGALAELRQNLLEQRNVYPSSHHPFRP
jgi:hypothetical protein